MRNRHARARNHPCRLPECTRALGSSVFRSTAQLFGIFRENLRPLQPTWLRLSAMISQYFIASLPFSSPDESPTPRNLSAWFSGLNDRQARGRTHKDRAFVLFTNHGGRQESSDLFALIRISTFYSLRGFFEHLDIERLEARIAQQFISSATMAATSSTPSRR
jgi:hypothetical protein